MKKNSVDKNYKIILVNSQAPDSFDPLDADKYNNMKPMRMMYSTPIESTSNNILTSSVLDQFFYNTEKREMIWQVKENAIYSDGTSITAEDVLFAVLRMIAVRPDFPVINKIQGGKEWAKLSNRYESLPMGITLSRNQIKFKFTEQIRNPLLRFSLEIFSIIPKRCVNLTTNKLSCELPPQSGYYKMKRRGMESLEFSLIKEPKEFHGILAPQHIEMIYKNTSDINSNNFDYDTETIIVGSDFRLLTDSPAFWQKVNKENNIKKMASSSYSFLTFNHAQHPFFRSAECRLKLANEFRSEFQKKMVDRYELESSLFPRIVAGYLTNKELQVAIHIEPKPCVSVRSGVVKWGVTKMLQNSWLPEVLSAALNNLNLKNELIIAENFSELEELFLKNEISIMYDSSGFWAQDPIGDLKMLLTKNMHEVFRDVYNNLDISNKLAKIDENSDSDTDIKKQMEEFNQAIYSDATINTYIHTQTSFISMNKDLIRELPQAVTAPSVWQLFNIQD